MENEGVIGADITNSEDVGVRIEEEAIKEEIEEEIVPNFANGEMLRTCLFCKQLKSNFDRDSAFGKICDNCFLSHYSEKYSKFLVDKLGSCSVCLNAFTKGEKLTKHDCTRSGVFVCIHCYKVYCKKLTIERHMIDRFEKRTCLACNASYCSDREFKLHFSLNESCNGKYVQKGRKLSKRSKRVVCSICNNYLSSKQSLKEHMLIHKPQKKKYNCNYCDKSFGYQWRLNQHKLIHKNNFVCRFCKKSFNRLNNFKVHMNIHLNQREFECKVCKKSFKRQANLKRHMKVHVSKEKIECSFCKWQFNKLSTLEQHVKIHCKDKRNKNINSSHTSLDVSNDSAHSKKGKYVCNVCKKSFSCSTTLNKHVHMRKKQFVCKYCDKTYTLLNSLNDHINSVHEKSKVYKCKHCKKEFYWARSLRRHLVIHE